MTNRPILPTRACNAQAIRNLLLLTTVSGLLAACGSAPMRGSDGGPAAKPVEQGSGDKVVRRPSTKGRLLQR